MAPTIVSPPAAATVAVGNTATFTVVASGTAPLAYQWMRRAPGAGAAAAAIPGATGTSFTTAATSLADDGAAYSVVVSNAGGSATSADAALHVMEPPAITSDPSSITVDIPQRALFTVGASGSAPLTYRWTFNGAPLSGAVSASIAFDPTAASEDGAVLVAIVSNAVGSVSSAPATLHVVTGPVITAQPQGIAVQAGQTATFTVSARGGQPLAFQWRKNGIDIPGATGASFTTPPAVAADANALFTVVVSNSFGTVTSAPATLTVGGGTAPGFAQPPADLTVTAGQPASFSVVATGDPAPTLQWRRGTVDIPGATSATFTVPATTPADDQAVFTVVATNPSGTATSTAARLTVQFAPQFTAQPAATTTVDAGQPATFTAAASGQPAPTFQWFRHGAGVPGATAASLALATTTAGDDGATFTVVATNAIGQATSTAARLSVRFAPQVVVQPQAQVVNAGQTATFSATIAGNPAPTFQWRRGAAAIPGATASTLSLVTTTADDGASFALAATNALGTVTTTAAALTVRSAPVITQQPAPATVFAGQPATFTVAATGNPAPTFQWFRDGAPIPGQTGATFTIAATALTDDGASFTATATNVVGQATSNAALLAVQPPVAPTIVTPPHDLSVTAGEPASFSVVAAGTAPLGYQWQRDLNDIPGATSPTFSLPATVLADGASTFRVVVSNVAGQVVSTAATLSVEVNQPPAPTAPAITVFELASATSQVSPGDPNLFQTWTYAVSTAPAHGTATVDANGLVTYTAAAGFSGADSVTVTVTDSGIPALSGAVAIAVTVKRAVTLTVTAGPDPIAPSNNVIGTSGFVDYELLVGNAGTAPVASVTLTDVTPNASTALRASSTGSPTCGVATNCAAGTTITWPAFALQPGEVRRFRLVTQVAQGTANGTVIHDAAALAYAGGTVGASLDVVTGAVAGLHLGMEDDRDPVRPGDTVTYTLVLTNSAAQALPVSGLGILSVPLPAGTTFASASGNGALVGGAVQWSFAFVPSASDQRFTFTVNVGSAVPTGTVLLASAQVLDGAQSLARALAATAVQAVPLALAVVADQDPVAPENNVTGTNGLFTEEIRVSNLGAAPVSNVVVSDIVRHTGAVVTLPAFSLGPNESRVFALLKRLDGTALLERFVHSAVTVTSSAGELAHGSDLVASAATGLRLGMEEDHDPARPGDALTYALVLTNTAAQGLPASGVGVLSVPLPAGTTFVSATNGGVLVAGEVRWPFGFVASGGDQRFTFTVRVNDGLADGTLLLAAAQVLDGAQSLVRVQALTTVQAAIPLALTVTTDQDPVSPFNNVTGANGFVTQEFRVSNLSSAPVTNIVLSDLVRSGATTLLAPSSGAPTCAAPVTCPDGFVVSWPSFSLAPGESRTFSLVKELDSSAFLDRFVHSKSTITSSAGVLMVGTDLVASAAAGLRVAIAQDHDPARPGDALTYALLLTNTAAQALPVSGQGVLSVPLPPGTTFVSATNGGALVGGEVRWSFAAIAASSDQHFGFTVLLGNTLAEGTLLVAPAQVLDGGRSLVRSQAATTVQAAIPLTLTVITDQDPAAPFNNVIGANGFVTQEFRVSNLGSAPVTNIVLSDLVRSGATTLLAPSTGAPTCAAPATCADGLVVSWPSFSLAPNESRTFSLVKEVDSRGFLDRFVHSTTRITSSAGALSHATDVVVGGAAGLRLAIEQDHDPVRAGDALTYSLLLTNTAAQALPVSGQGVLSVPLPAGTTFASASGGGALVGGEVRWTFSAAGAGADLHFTFTVAVGTAPAGTVLAASARVLDGGQSLVRAEAATTVQATVPLTLTVVTNPDPVAPFNNVTGANGLVAQEFRVSNLSAAPVTNIVLSDLVRSGAITLLASSTGAPTCAAPVTCADGLVVAWPSFSLAPNETRTFSLVKQVDARAFLDRFVHSMTRITSSAGTFSLGTDLVPSAAAGLRLGIEEDHDPARPGDQLTYTLTLGNTALAALPASGQGVLSVPLPAGTTFLSASGTGALVGDEVRWSFASVAASSAQRFTFTVAVGNALPDGTILLAAAQALDGAVSVARAQAATAVQAAPAVAMTLTAAPDPVANLGNVVYTATITNVSGALLGNVVFAELALANANVLVASSTPGASCGGPLTCGPGAFVAWPAFSLAAGASQTFTWTAQVVVGARGTVVNSSAVVVPNGALVRLGRDVVTN